jgi:hypothetical protein
MVVFFDLHMSVSIYLDIICGVLGQTLRFAAQQNSGVNRHGIGQNFHMGKPGPLHQLHKLERRSEPTRTHRQQIKVKVGIALGLFTSCAGHGFSQ